MAKEDEYELVPEKKFLALESKVEDLMKTSYDAEGFLQGNSAIS